MAQNLCGLPDEWKAIDVLVNNAGLAVGLNPIQDGVVDDWERMIDTNVKGLLYVTRGFQEKKKQEAPKEKKFKKTRRSPYNRR